LEGANGQPLRLYSGGYQRIVTRWRRPGCGCKAAFRTRVERHRSWAACTGVLTSIRPRRDCCSGMVARTSAAPSGTAHHPGNTAVRMPVLTRTQALGATRSESRISPKVRISMASTARRRAKSRRQPCFSARGRSAACSTAANASRRVGRKQSPAPHDSLYRNATHSAVVSWAAGRPHGPDDAEVEPGEVDVGRRATALLSDI
jgi:hypothetical protein